MPKVVSSVPDPHWVGVMGSRSQWPLRPSSHTLQPSIYFRLWDLGPFRFKPPALAHCGPWVVLDRRRQ
ncbi:hypothetical protein EVAR_82695_1 [Eumeta japonica]|uniref:Uncharacterized protein n=1 Tax=Eumeta variegata TaxID=151549 RepID=A0A4C1VB78_EUMVA|nr:hypothetical protein EVAR_82695_1 [Eumeta japonica]